jgi:hypothetical protein
MNDVRLAHCFDAGMSLLVATATRGNIPVCCRAVALSSTDGGDTVTVYLPMATSQETMQNVATTRRMVITASHPISHVSIQLKGTTMDARIARDDESAFVRSQLDAFAEMLDTIGIPRALTRNAVCWPAFAVSMRVEQVFEQTPGPSAGSRVR